MSTSILSSTKVPFITIQETVPASCSRCSAQAMSRLTAPAREQPDILQQWFLSDEQSPGRALSAHTFLLRTTDYLVPVRNCAGAGTSLPFTGSNAPLEFVSALPGRDDFILRVHSFHPAVPGPRCSGPGCVDTPCSGGGAEVFASEVSFASVL